MTPKTNIDKIIHFFHHGTKCFCFVKKYTIISIYLVFFIEIEKNVKIFTF